MDDVPPSGNVAALLARAGRCWPRLAALALADRVVCDYVTLAGRAARIAGALEAAGLAEGERVAIVSRNTPEYIEALFGCWWAGLVVVPVNAKLHARELAYILEDSGARFAFVDSRWQAAIAGASL
jgi:long-chain acyl-CoA synthetase